MAAAPVDDWAFRVLAAIARNRVAADLVLLFFLIGGLLSLSAVRQEVFPQFDLDVITVDVPYPGASPEEVEEGILLSIEESVRALDGVKVVRSTAWEGRGLVTIELRLGADADRVLSDVRGAVDRLVALPREAERPVISRATSRLEVVSLILSGAPDLPTLRRLAEEAREALLLDPGISVVEIHGLPPREIAVEVPIEELRRHRLSLPEIAGAIGRASVDVPGGVLETRSGEILVRTSERRTRAEAYADVVVVSRPDGSRLRVRDLGQVIDGFEEVEDSAYYDGVRAVELRVFQIGEQRPLDISAAVRRYVDERRPSLPPGVRMELWNDSAEIYADRIGLLLRNGQIGLVLVLLLLGLFLNLRLAFWVTIGIPASFLGATMLLPLLDVSFNMISLFAYIVTLGLVVDDAIVVGEAVYSRRERGMSWAEAAARGARDVLRPVLFAIVTTIIAFAPMLFVPGASGRFFRVIPLVVIPVLLVSLVEAFFVLPAHLAGGRDKAPGRAFGAIEAVQARVGSGVRAAIERGYRPLVRWALTHRALSLATAAALLLVVGSIVFGGHLPFTFLPRIEGDVAVAEIRLPPGSPVEDTIAAQDRIVAAAQNLLEELGDGQRVDRGIFSLVGRLELRGGPAGADSRVGGHLARVSVLLVADGVRPFAPSYFVDRWREEVGDLPGVEMLRFESGLGPGAGPDLSLELSHPDSQTLEHAAERLAAALAGYRGVRDVDDGVARGKEQFDLYLRPEARRLGVTEVELGEQVRAAFQGAEAERQQIGREEVRTIVRLPPGQRESEADLARLWVRTPGGGELPLLQAADARRGRAFTEILRRDGRRVVEVTASVDGEVTSAGQILSALEQETLPSLMEEIPGLSWALAGTQEAQQETFASLGVGVQIALLAMFALLAAAFGSYLQPLLIFVAVPFAGVGAVLGHLLMGYELSVTSVLGMVALTGVVVNDSLLLISAANARRAEGLSALEAAVEAGARRFRPILLTSLTTFFGLAPLLLERSVQARFLIPMAISLGFGVLFATLVTLLLVPVCYVLLEQVRQAVAGLVRREA